MLGPKSSTWAETAQAVQSIAKRYLESAGIRSEISVLLVPSMSKAPIPQLIRRALIMATRELLKNSAHHARPKDAKVKLEVQPNRVVLWVSDSGVGVEADGAFSKGRGLAQLRKRLQELGGTVEISHQPGEFSVQVQIPLDS